MNSRYSLIALALLTAGCAAAPVPGRVRVPVPVRRSPPARPVPRAADRVVDLRYPPDGRLVVKFGDGTIGAVVDWSSGSLTTLWRSPFRVRDFDSAPHTVCVLTEEGAVGCLYDEAPGPLVPLLRVSTARTLAIARNGEVCVTTTSGATRCHDRSPTATPSVAERVFNAHGKLRKIVPRTFCGIDFDGRLLCLAAERGGAFVPGVILEHVLDASLIPHGPYAGSGCALTMQRTVECWGPHRNGEVGIGRRSWSAPRSTVPGSTAITAVSAAPGKACAVRADGAVYCWGTAFGPDSVRAAARVPRCQTKTTTRKLEPCPGRPPGDRADDPCRRQRWRSRRAGARRSPSPSPSAIRRTSASRRTSPRTPPPRPASRWSPR